jgi:thiosulfate dehydrogenase [quinone] large subunit
MRTRPIDKPADPAIVVGLLPRFFLGAIFLIAAMAKITAPRGFATAISGFIMTQTNDAPPWYQGFLHTAVIPHLATWSLLIVGGEIFVAISLLLGLLTRVGAIVALYLLVNYMLAKGQVIWSPTSNDAADIMLAIVIAMTGPGRILGIDAYLAR